MIQGERIKKIRVEKGLTQKDLAEKMDVSPQAVSKFEKMENLQAGTIRKLAEALEVEVDELMPEEKKHFQASDLFISTECNTLQVYQDEIRKTFNHFEDVAKAYLSITPILKNDVEQGKHINALLDWMARASHKMSFVISEVATTHESSEKLNEEEPNE